MIHTCHNNMSQYNALRQQAAKETGAAEEASHLASKAAAAAKSAAHVVQGATSMV